MKNNHHLTSCLPMQVGTLPVRAGVRVWAQAGVWQSTSSAWDRNMHRRDGCEIPAITRQDLEMDLKYVQDT